MSTSFQTSGVVLAACVAAVTAVWMHRHRRLHNQKNDSTLPAFLTDTAYADMVVRLHDHLHQLSGDALCKIVRQLDFWVREKSLTAADLVALTERLIRAATWQQRSTTQTVPKVRFGRTELHMPIVTCGAMRFQFTWCPDYLPIAIKPDTVLQTLSQENICDIVAACLRVGINHFETARFYGTSEIQLSDALAAMLRRGEIQRCDFILQTKVAAADPEKCKKGLEQSWKNLAKLGHIDLFAFHCVSKDNQVEWCLNDNDDGIMSVVKEWQAMGRIKFIGFSTHGTADNIFRLVDSNKFDFVNLHEHYFGDYHACGTPDGRGSQGNAAAVARALELDMGVFGISPIDKGGRLYQPSAVVARTIGPELTPIAFAALTAWETYKMHTVTIGFARPEDVTEILEAAELFANKKKMKPLLDGATARLDQLAVDKLGKEWKDKGLLNLPSPLKEEADGIGLGHTLWCSNMLHAYGMYDTAKARYSNLMAETKKWNKKKSFAENIIAL